MLSSKQYLSAACKYYNEISISVFYCIFADVFLNTYQFIKSSALTVFIYQNVLSSFLNHAMTRKEIKIQYSLVWVIFKKFAYCNCVHLVKTESQIFKCDYVSLRKSKTLNKFCENATIFVYRRQIIINLLKLVRTSLYALNNRFESFTDVSYCSFLFRYDWLCRFRLSLCSRCHHVNLTNYF